MEFNVLDNRIEKQCLFSLSNYIISSKHEWVKKMLEQMEYIMIFLILALKLHRARLFRSFLPVDNVVICYYKLEKEGMEVSYEQLLVDLCSNIRRTL